jgi:GNAT superfamily N-acetyltransferase
MRDVELLQRGEATLLASWDAYAQACPSASLHRFPGVGVGVFPEGPERSVYNNALLERGLDRAGRATALDAMVAAYDEAGVGAFAAWVHESDDEMRADLERRGFCYDSSTLAMGAELDRIERSLPPLDLVVLAWSDYLSLFDFPAGLLRDADHRVFHVRCARDEGEVATTAMAFDHLGDCGIFNVTTLPAARRRGLGTAITSLQMHEARARGCTTATLQSTPMAEGVYAAAGFVSLGRYLELVPPPVDRGEREHE